MRLVRQWENANHNLSNRKGNIFPLLVLLNLTFNEISNHDAKHTKTFQKLKLANVLYFSTDVIIKY